LPWQNLNVDKDRRRQVIGDMKKRVSVSEITESLPDVFATYLNIVRNLHFAERPNYTLLRELFKKCSNDQKFVNDGIYDWTQVPSSRLPIPFPQITSNHKKKSHPVSIEIIDPDNNKPSIARKKRKTMEPQKPELSPQPKSAKTTNNISLRPRNRRSTITTTTLDYEISHEVIEISDDCS